MILVVDDHADTREALLRLLKRWGYEGMGVKSGAEALLFLRSHVVRLVILDYHMPGIDGLSVFEEMRKDARLAGVPVILFTADSGGRLRQRAAGQGVHAYFEKGSVDWGQFLGEIRRLAGDGELGAQSLPSADA